jgi:mono/diheme cytochrome c family protein
MLSLILLGVLTTEPEAVGNGGASAATSTPAPDFERDIRPIFVQHCASCHGESKQRSGYRVDVRQTALAGGDLGEAAIVPGKPDESRLLDRVSDNADRSERMPPANSGVAALTPEQVHVLRDWIAGGAVWPDSLAGEQLDQRHLHWAWQPLVRPPVPDVGEPHPIDAFITARLRGAGLERNPPADRRSLGRRLSFDLTGLPPEPERLAAFVAEDRPDAAAKYVDELLASPRYGERWARHWLDVVRFAESDGFETNRIRPNAWPYRDYVIAAFNNDTPYDRFILEQLAGDAVGVDAATGFLVGGAVDIVTSPDPALTAQQRSDALHDMVTATGSAFLGLTVNCARCHDHKFDPIRASDYFAMVACFSGVRHGERNIRPGNYAERLAEADSLRSQRGPLLAKIAAIQPTTHRQRLLLLDDTNVSAAEVSTPAVFELVPPRGVEQHAAGTGRGEANDPGDLLRLPNLGGNFQWWDNVAHQTLLAYAPRVNGLQRVWISWGCGRNSHARDAAYLLDADGDPATTGDQTEIARVDQRLFADGTGMPLPDKPLWSGFRDAGVHTFTPTTRLLLKAGATADPVSADVVLFEDLSGLSADVLQTRLKQAGSLPPLRPLATAREQVDRFPPVDAKFVRFTVKATNLYEPCLDELEVFSVEATPRNVAAASAGGVPTSSGNYPESSKHRLSHVNDGRYGNDFSWISSEVGGGWVQIEFPNVERIDRVVWSRDRLPTPQFNDRTAVEYEISVSLDGTTWSPVANSDDRLPQTYPHRPAPIRTLIGVSPEQFAVAEKAVKELAALDARIQSLVAMERLYAGTFTDPEPTFRLHRGDPLQPREPIEPGPLSSFPGEWSLSNPGDEQQRRIALARWIASPENRLTARVMVNRVWHYHFGVGLVDTPSDFGLNGGRPSHPELIDWLAAEFIASGWSVKSLHRIICGSRTYQQSAANNPAAQRIDTSNRLLWRFPSRRLEAEALRDAILSVSGQLNLTMGGPGFDLFEPNNNYVKVYTTKTTFTSDDFRRMVYQTKPRGELDTLFGSFDCPDAGQIAPRRTVSTTPLQALNLLNSAFLLEQSDRFAERLKQERPGDSAGQIDRAFQLAFGRSPAESEASAAASLVADHGLSMLCRALFNANEFVIVY